MELPLTNINPNSSFVLLATPPLGLPPKNLEFKTTELIRTGMMQSSGAICMLIRILCYIHFTPSALAASDVFGRSTVEMVTGVMIEGRGSFPRMGDRVVISPMRVEVYRSVSFLESKRVSYHTGSSNLTFRDPYPGLKTMHPQRQL